MDDTNASSTRIQRTRSRAMITPRSKQCNTTMGAAVPSVMEAALQEFNRRMAMTLLVPPPMPAVEPVQPVSQTVKPVRVQPPPEVEIAVIPEPPQDQKSHSSGKRRREASDTRTDREEDMSSHVLMPNLGKARILCRLCSKRGLKTRSRFGCVQCRLGFHVECFAVFHHPDLFFTNPSDTVQDALGVMTNNSSSRPATRRRENQSIMSYEQLTVPSTSDQE